VNFVHLNEKIEWIKIIDSNIFRTSFLEPTDPLFVKIGKSFIDEVSD